jgi:hypothetical protein
MLASVSGGVVALISRHVGSSATFTPDLAFLTTVGSSQNGLPALRR